MKYDFMISFYDTLAKLYLNHFDVMKISPKCESDQDFFFIDSSSALESTESTKTRYDH